jgi:hypothetical protein
VLASGASGAVIRGTVIDFATAVARRQMEESIVVCGNDLKANGSLARAIESAVGPWIRQEPHDQVAGPLALPHFQQKSRSPGGHSFYEPPNRKSRKKP